MSTYCECYLQEADKVILIFDDDVIIGKNFWPHVPTAGNIPEKNNKIL
jgi:hypothetical protein